MDTDSYEKNPTNINDPDIYFIIDVDHMSLC